MSSSASPRSRSTAAGRRAPRGTHPAAAWSTGALLGSGTLCEVFDAWPGAAPGPGSAVYALKRLRAQWHDQPRAVAALRREAELGRSISQPHLVAVLAAHVAAPPYFVVMPKLAGAPLSARLAGGLPVPLPAALWIARQTAEALAALNDAGWMHGDVKPQNILVGDQWHVTLLDLGFARRVDAAADSLWDRVVVGTLAYAAPEMLTSAVRPDARSDLYSLGATLYETLGGRPPFLASETAELVRCHREVEPEDLRSLNPSIPSRVVRIVHQLLAKDPLRRFQSPRELIEALLPLEIATLRLYAADEAG